MTTKIVLSDLASLTNETSAIATINGNSSTIETASNNFLSRDGTTPNTMLADLDMNGYRILNLPAPLFDTDVLRLEDGSGTGGGGGGGGSGTVTAVAMTVPSTFSIAGTPITSSGTLALSLNGGGDNTKYLRADNTWAVPATGVASSIAVGTSISGGVSGRILYDNSGAIGEMTTTGSGTVVALATSPTLVTPLLGTPTSGNLLNCVGYPIGSVANLGTGMATFLATPTSANLISTITDETGTGALVFATSPTLVTPLLGTPTSGTLTNCTGYLVSNLSGFGTGISTFLSTPSSANLATAVTDETGSGLLVFNNSPSFTTPSLGMATATGLVITSATSTALAVGPSGSTSSCLQVDASTTSAVAGLKITGAASGSGVALVAIGGTNEPILINAKGNSGIGIGSVSTGDVSLGNTSGGQVRINGAAGSIALRFVNDNLTGLGSRAALEFNAYVNTTEVMRWTQTNITTFSTLTAQSTLVSNVTRTIASANLQAGTSSWADVNTQASTTTISGSTNISSFVLAKNQFEVPVLTASAAAVAITSAINVYIAGAPTTSSSGGFTPTITSPYALYVASGPSFFGGGVSTNNTNDGYGLFVSHSPTTTSAATVTWQSFAVSSTLTLTGTTTVSNDTAMVVFGQPLITDASAVTVSKASTVYITGAPVGGGSATVTAAGAFALKIGAGNVSHPASGYINFGNTSGTTGYGFRDNSGTMQFSNSGGSWTNFGVSSLTIGTTTITSGTTQRLLYDNGGVVGETTNIYSDGTFFSLGDSTQRAFGTTSATFQLNGTASGAAQMGIGAYSSSSGNATANNAGQFCFYRSKSGTVGSATVPAAEDILGSIRFLAAQQTSTFATQTEAARIMAVADGTITSGASADMPGRLMFMTTPDGSGTVTERMRIDNQGNVIVGTAALNTTATDGFLYIPTCAGAPTGNSTDYSGMLPIVYDSSNNKLYINTSGTTWKGVTLA